MASGFSSSSTAEEVTAGIDGSGLTAIVTGASSGIGIETTRVLALRGVHVVMAVRNVNSGDEVKETITKEIPSAKLDVMELDLSAMASIRKFASDFISSHRSLNILINNAGIYGAPFMLSKDNIELQFATNHLGHFLLTNLLLDMMKETARSTKREGRIVNVSSIAHMGLYEEGIRFDRLNDERGYSTKRECRIVNVSSKGHTALYEEGIRFDKLNDAKGYDGLSKTYGQSKLCNILHANELARRLKEDGEDITANSLHPGVILTNISRYLGGPEGFELIMAKNGLECKSIQQGASTTCYVALHPQVKGISGEYFSDNNLAKPSDMAQDKDLARKLWDFSMGLTK